MSNEIQTIVKWFSDAKPNPTIEDACVQIGCHFEEFGEILCSIGFEADHDLVFDIDLISRHYKRNGDKTLKNDVNMVDLLDSLCDQIVTAVGVGQLMGFDIVGALNEVIASNDSKRMPDGSFPLDENGKITKESPNFFKPDLSNFIGGNND